MTIDVLRMFKKKNVIIFGVIAIISFVIGLFGSIFVSMIFFVATIIPFMASLILFICSFGLSIRRYEVDGNIVICYAGWKNHYLILNDEIVDEHITDISFVALELSYKDENHEYIMKVSISNNISLKVDGKLVREYSKF